MVGGSIEKCFSNNYTSYSQKMTIKKRQQNCDFRHSKSRKLILQRICLTQLKEILILLKIHKNYI